MNLNIIICEDEPEHLIQVVGFLKRFGQESGHTIQIVTFSSGEELLADYPDTADILILDIRMGDVSGMDAAKEIRRRGKNVPIIFLTSLAQYALEGYDVQAVSFLLKPVPYETLREKLTLVAQRLARERGHILKLKNNTGICLIPVKDIDYVEAQKHQVIVCHEGKKDAFLLPISQMEDELVSDGFFRCHKGYLINMKRIRRIEADAILMDGGLSVPLSRHRRAEFLKAFDAFMGEQMYG